MNIHWFPGHMHKATKSIREILPKIDLIIEVLDARVPYSSENPVIQQLDPGIQRLKLLNKADLADSNITQLWLNYLNKHNNIKALAVSAQKASDIKQIVAEIDHCLEQVSVQAGLANILIVGIPNVGKSTLINHLTQRRSAKTGNEPAVTRDIQRIKLNDDIMFWDSPGILWPKVEHTNSSYRLALIGSIKDTAFEYDDVGVFAADYFLAQYPEQLKLRYGSQAMPESALDLLTLIAKVRGCMSKGGADFEKASRLLIQDIRELKISAFSLETPDMMLQELKEAEDMKALKEEKKAKRKAKAKKNRP